MPHDSSPPGSSVRRISQARILEWAAISFSRGVFPTQGSNSHLLHWQADSSLLSHLGSPFRALRLCPNLRRWNSNQHRFSVVMMPGESSRGPRPLISRERSESIRKTRHHHTSLPERGRLYRRGPYRQDWGVWWQEEAWPWRRETLCSSLKGNSHPIWICSSLCDQSM